MAYDALANWAVSCLILGLRIVPVFVFAPPFTLIRIPLLFRVLFGFALSVALLASHPEATMAASRLSTVFLGAIRELALGFMFVLAFQLAFGALYMAGRTIDIQAGFGLALLIDPTSQSQTPLVGTLFAYAAGAVFFASNGHLELLRLIASTLDAIPLGTWAMPSSAIGVATFLSMAFLTAFGIAGGAVLALWLVDLSIALLSRTVPQMNVLVLGFQVKTIVLFLVLPTSFGVAGALLVRIMARTLEAVPRML
jgi:flagellar biosynthetic protein FliR